MSNARHTVTKIIDFCYGHRLMNHPGKCRHLHGHNGRLEISIETDRLDEVGIAVDFKVIGEKVKGWVDEHLDHRMLLHRDDPALPSLEALGEPVRVMDDHPTAENIAKLIYQEARSMGLEATKVRCWETPTCHATYRER